MATPDAKPAKTAVQLKTPKGTRDWSGADMHLRDEVFQTITDVFKRHGGTPLDTPVFELKEILAGKYGEDARLMYDLEDQGGELCSLRFDLTVPFARWLAMNNIQQVKRYQIAKVYRRDQPAIARGRLREFHQCDFDIAGVYDPMIPDAEILRVVVEVFRALQLDITIKMNHRRILDGLFAVSGVPADRIRPISSAVDKLDKMPWAEVKKEMVEEKGLPEDVADRIGGYVQRSGTIRDMLKTLQADAELCANGDVKAGLDDVSLLADYLEALEVADTVSFDLSLARGLDYYTGLIFEVIVNHPSSTLTTANGTTATIPAESVGDGSEEGAKQQSASKKGKKAGEDPASQVGSIAAGGRYDNLVGMYGRRQIPCVGISFGVDRIFTILKARREQEEESRRTRLTDVYVMAFGGKEFDGLLLERMAVARRLWDAGVRTEFAPKVKPRLPQQFKAAGDVPLAVILGQDELAAGQVRLKVLGQGEDDEKDRGRLVAMDDLVSEVKKLLL
ncbi:hypothetical protein VTK73DRAFT_1470 [Phialemonium thermophilum]|uniref:histidine--tRNA ligase n=1 Tax=Phialemonium thermophilum TaxID=223376 RepID=A0ABR3XA41_9PEZI